MNNKIHKAFQKHYSDVLSQAVENETEIKLKNLLIEKIEALESDSSIWPTAQQIDSLSFKQLSQRHSIDQLMNSCLSSLKLNETDAIKAFPRLNLSLSFSKYSFKALQANKQIPVLIKSLLVQIKLPLFKLIVSHPEYLENLENSAFKLITSILDYIPIWKDESAVGYPTYTKLSQILAFSVLPVTDIDMIFDRALQPVQQININQAKRAIIFEKRLVETQKGLFTKERAENRVATLVEEVNTRYELPKFIQDILDSSWKRLLILDYVRNDSELFSTHLRTMMVLVLSANQEIGPTRLDWLISCLPQLTKDLNEGFIRLADEGLDREIFFTKLEAMHIKIIEHNNDNAGSSIDDNLQVKTITNSDEEILRLKPNQILFSGSEADVGKLEAIGSIGIKADRHEKKEQSISESFDVTNRTNDIFISMTENILALDQEFGFSVDRIDNYYDADQANQLSAQLDTIRKDHKFLIGGWFTLKSGDKNEQILVKLVLVDQPTGHYLFCNQDNKITHQLNPSQLLDLISAEKICKYIPPEFVENGVKSCVRIMKLFLSDQKNKSEQERLNKVIDDNLNKNRSAQPEVIDSEGTKNPISKDSAISSNTKPEQSKHEQLKPEHQVPLDIESLSVGSWILFKDSDVPIKCKLAAKIISKSLLVFVDRKGKKVREIKTSGLDSLYLSGDIELANVERTSENILESVISKTRTLKSEY